VRQSLRRPASERRSIAILIFAPLLLTMAVAQLASLGRFEDVLRAYRLFGDAVAALAVVVPVVEGAVAAALLLRQRFAPTTVRAAAVGGIAITLFWSALAAQAFARGVELDNCGCFGAYLAQELRWWVLLEDAEFVLLAVLAARGPGMRLWRRRSHDPPEDETPHQPEDEMPGEDPDRRHPAEAGSAEAERR
jgi:hypothetical protein